MTTNTDTDQVGYLITTEFGTSPLSFPKGVTNVAPYVYGASRTYAGVPAPEAAVEEAPVDEVAASAPVVEETAVVSPEPGVEEAPVVETPAAPEATSVASDVEGEVKKVEADAEKVVEEIKAEAEKVVTDVEDAAKKAGL